MTGGIIRNITQAESVPGVRVFQAGTKLDDAGNLVATGGRVLAVCATADTLASARVRTYEGIARIDWPDGIYRHDIGQRALDALAEQPAGNSRWSHGRARVIVTCTSYSSITARKVPAHAPQPKPVLIEGEGLHGAARVRAVTAVALSVLLALLDYAIANVALPTIAGDLHVSPAAAVWIVNAYQLASVVSLLPMAALGTRIGFARLCQIGLALLTVASLFCALSHTLLALALARAVQGVGGACIMSVSIALIRFIYACHTGARDRA